MQTVEGEFNATGILFKSVYSVMLCQSTLWFISSLCVCVCVITLTGGSMLPSNRRVHIIYHTDMRTICLQRINMNFTSDRMDTADVWRMVWFSLTEKYITAMHTIHVLLI